MNILALTSNTYDIDLLKYLPTAYNIEIKHPLEIGKISSFEKFDTILCFLKVSEFEIIKENLITTSRSIILKLDSPYIFSENILKKINNKNLRWVHAKNFSLTSCLLNPVTQILKKIENLIDDNDFEIHEHFGKDIPFNSQATALKLALDFGPKTHIINERIGDTPGIHILKAGNEEEFFRIQHHVNDHKVYARGILWAIQMTVFDPFIASGLHHFETLVTRNLFHVLSKEVDGQVEEYHNSLPNLQKVPS